jgi:hypothetical protein
MLCKEGFRTHGFLQLFQYIFYPQRKEPKGRFISSSCILFNIDDSQGQGTYQVKTIFRPSIPDNQEYLQVFENDEHLVNFLTDDDPITSSDPEEDQNSQEKFMNRIINLPQRNILVWNPSLREMIKWKFQNHWKNPLSEFQETQKINIGTL